MSHHSYNYRIKRDSSTRNTEYRSTPMNSKWLCGLPAAILRTGVYAENVGATPSAGVTTRDGFTDPGGEDVHILRNEGSVTAETIAVQLLPTGADQKIESPTPGNCPVQAAPAAV